MIEKVALVCPNIGIVYSGMGPDFRVLVAQARKSAQAYWKIYQEYPPTRVLVAELASNMQSATQSGCASIPHLHTSEQRMACSHVLSKKTVVFGRMACLSWSQVGTRAGAPRSTKSILQAATGRGKPVRSAKTK